MLHDKINLRLINYVSYVQLYSIYTNHDNYYVINEIENFFFIEKIFLECLYTILWKTNWLSDQTQNK